jgi:hypothetical protein
MNAAETGRDPARSRRSAGMRGSSNSLFPSGVSGTRSSSLLKKSDRSVMKEEKESERGYSRIFLASLPLAANQSCVAQF